MIRLQARDLDVQRLRQLVNRPPQSAQHAKVSFKLQKGILFRTFTQADRAVKQLVVPKGLRESVLRQAHDSPMAGHMGSKRTLERVRQDFFWPGMNSQVRQYCRSCDVCQQTTPKGRLTRGSVPLVGEPLSKVGVDLVRLKRKWTHDDEDSVSVVQGIPTVPLVKGELGSNLSSAQTKQLHKSCQELQDVLTDRPLHSTPGECAFTLTTKAPVRERQYPLPHFQASVVQQDVAGRRKRKSRRRRRRKKKKVKKPDRLVWDDRCQQAFHAFKTALTTRPVLALPDPHLPFVLRTDASAVGVGAVLLQDQGKGLQPLAYASKKLTDAETRYHTIEQECLAVVWGIRKFYPYLYGREFVLESDHHPLQYLDRIRPVSRRLMGWAVELQSHAFTFRHIKGTNNVDADYLSRAP